MVKFRKPVYIIPYVLIRCMENMCSVLMHMDSFHIFTINISRYMIPLVDYETGLSFFSKLICHNRAVQSCADDQIIIFFHTKPLFPHRKILCRTDLSCILTEYHFFRNFSYNATLFVIFVILPMFLIFLFTN